MKRVFIILFLIIDSLVSAKTFYISPTGMDSYPGTGAYDHPWATFSKGITMAYAGDTVYFRGGTYNLTASVIIYPPKTGHDGTAIDPICYFNYPTENPIFDCIGITGTESYNMGIQMWDVDYLKFKGLTFVNVKQLGDNKVAWGIYNNNCTNITFENMTVHNIGGHGFFANSCDLISYINCDAYDCADILNLVDPGNSATGFDYVNTNIGASIRFYGCRAWHCADDGISGHNEGPAYIDRCWSWNHGYLGGSGNGFKFGPVDKDIPLHATLTKCISAYNKLSGFSENNDGRSRSNCFIYNCTAYKNYHGFMAWNPIYYLDNENVYRNNISYDNSNGNYFGKDGNGYVHSNNSWDIPLTIVDSSFVSLDYTEMLRPRKADGSLPEIDFMKLRATSILKDKGTTDTELPYADNAPDLGAWEYGLELGSGNTYPSVVITFPSGVIKFNAPATITINANPSDIDGTIKEVEFFSGDSSIGYKTSSPWSITWDLVQAGTYSLTAVATDDLDARTTSAAVIVYVKSDIINLYPNPNNGSFTLVLKEPLQRNGEITISSVDGKLIYIGTMLQEQLTKSFNLQYIKDGYYTLVLSGYEIVLTKKFFKQ